MRGNSIGNFLTLTTFGESHGVALGAIIDGCPAGLALAVEDFEFDLLRRRPGQNKLVTPRNESDRPEVLSGIFEGKTLGTPICVIIRNGDVRSSDYDANFFRAGHADRTWQEKFGHRDYRGGGRASGRETIGRVIGGTIAKKILQNTNIEIIAFTKQIGKLSADIPKHLTLEKIECSPLRCPDPRASAEMEALLLRCKKEGDSRGGVVELRILGAPKGLGEPVFGKLKSRLADAFFGIGAVVGVQLGDARGAIESTGKEFHTGTSGSKKEDGVSSSAYGIQGGISNGEDIQFDIVFKPTSTVGEKAKQGRHDPCILPRAIPVLEAMAWITLADLWLATRLDKI